MWKVLIQETPSVSVKDRLGIRGGQMYAPGPRPGQDYHDRYRQSQGQYGPGGTPTYRDRIRYDQKPYRFLEARKKSTSYSSYSDQPPNMALSQPQTPSFNRTPPPRHL